MSADSGQSSLVESDRTGPARKPAGHDLPAHKSASPQSASGQPTAHQQTARRRPMGMRKLAIVLLVSAVAFAFLIIRQRNANVRGSALTAAEAVQSWVQDFLDQKAFLPSRVPDDIIGKIGNPCIAYPDRIDLVALRPQQGPFVLVAGRFHPILPAGKGCAALVYEQGRVSVNWLDGAEAKQARTHRKSLCQNR